MDRPIDRISNPEDDFLGGYEPAPEGALTEFGIGTLQGGTADLFGMFGDMGGLLEYVYSPYSAFTRSADPNAAPAFEPVTTEYLGEKYFPPVGEGLEGYREAGRLTGGMIGGVEMLTAKLSSFLGRQIQNVFRNTDGVLIAVTPDGVQIPVPDDALPDTSVMQMADEGGEAPVQGDLFDQSRLDPDDPRGLPTDLDAFLAASAQRRDAELADLQKAFREGYQPGPRRANTPLTVSELNMLRAMRAGKGGARGLLHGIRGAKNSLYLDQGMVENFGESAYRPYSSITDPGRPDLFTEELTLYGGPFELQGFTPSILGDPADTGLYTDQGFTLKDLILGGGLGQRSRKILGQSETAASAEGLRPGFSVSRDPLISVRGFTDQGDATGTFNVSSLEDTVIVIPSVQLRRHDSFGNPLARDDYESFTAGEILESDLENLSPTQYLLKAYDPDKSILLKPNTEFREDELHLGSGQGFGTPAGAVVRNLTAREKEDLVRYSNRIAIQRDNLKKIQSLNDESSAFTNISGPDRMNYNTLGFGNPELVTKGIKELEEEIVILGTMEAESPLMLNLTRDRFVTALGPKISIALESPEFRAAWAAKHGNEGLAALEELGANARVLDPVNRESRPSISNRRQAVIEASENFHFDLIDQEINEKLNLPERGFTIEFQHGGEGKYERTLKLYPTDATMTAEQRAAIDKVKANDPGDLLTTELTQQVGMPKVNQGYDLQEALIEALRTNSDGLYGEAARRLTPENRDLGVLILAGIRRVEKRYVNEVDKLPEAQSFNAIYRNNKYILQNAIETAGKAFPATGTNRIDLDPELAAALQTLRNSKNAQGLAPEIRQQTADYARDIVAKREARMRPAGAQLYAEGGIVSMIPDVVQKYHGGGGVHVHPNIRTGRISDFRTGDTIVPQMYEYDFYTPAEMRDGNRVPSPIEMQTGVMINDFMPAFPDVPVDDDGDGVVDFMVQGMPAVMPEYQGDDFTGRIPLTTDQQALLDRKRAQTLGDVEYIADMMALEGPETYGLMASAFDMDAQRKEEALRNLGVASMIPQLLAEEQALFTQMPTVLSTETAQTSPSRAYGTYYPGVDKIIMDTQNVTQSIDRGMPFQSQLTNMHELMHAGIQKRVADMIARRPEYFQNLAKVAGPGIGGFDADKDRFRQVMDVDGMYALLNVPLENRQLFENIYDQYIQATLAYNQSGSASDLAVKDKLFEQYQNAREALLVPYLTAPYGGEEEYSLGHSLIAVPTVTEFLPKILNRGTLVEQAFGSSQLRDYAERYLPSAHFADVKKSAAEAGLLEKYPIMKHFFEYGHFAGVIPYGKTYGEPGVEMIFPEGFDTISPNHQSHAGQILTRVMTGNLHSSNKDMSTINYHAGGENLAPFVQQIRDFNVEFMDFVLDKHRSLTSRYRADIIEPGMSGAAITPEDVVIQDLFLENQAEQAASERAVAELTGN